MTFDYDSLKNYSIYRDKDDESPIGIKNDLMDYVIATRKKYNSYEEIPREFKVEVTDIVSKDSVLTVDVTKKRIVPLRALKSQFVPLTEIDLT